MDKNSTVQLYTGSKMPVMALGTWQLDIDTEGTTLYALKIGYIQIDTSSDYGTQPGIGEGIKESGIERKDIYITTKVEETDDAYERTKSNLEELGTEYIDLELIHRPPFSGAGQDLWEGLIRAQKEGLVRDIGVSSYSIELIEELIGSCGITPAVNQIEWSPFGYSEEMAKYCRVKNIIIQAYSPLTRGKRLDDPVLNRISGKYGKSPVQVLIRWNLQQGTVPLPKANQKKHLEENIDVFDFELDEGDMRSLNSLNRFHSSLGNLPYI